MEQVENLSPGKDNDVAEILIALKDTEVESFPGICQMI